jgi:cytochrome c-type biogenesis protein
MGSGTYLLGFLAGLLSTFNPCVLPLIPLVVGSAASAHRFGPLALSAGVLLSFVGLGLFIATIGFGLGLDATVFRAVGGVVMVALGLVLVSGPLQQRFALAGGEVASMAEGWMGRVAVGGWQGQFLLGLLLGVVWTPCVGPTLGAASLMAARGENLGQVASVMILFGIGATVPLLVIGTLSRQAMVRWRGKMAAAGSAGKTILGVLMLVLGASILSGFDHALEAWLVTHMPTWLLNLTTQF